MKLEQRMYGLVMYNISPIQQGIQYGHALQEYNNMMFEPDIKFSEEDVDAFDNWRLDDKTFIILNGGTSNERHSSPHYGSLNQHRDYLKSIDKIHACFYEPDLNDALSAIVFLVDEKVFDEKKYPNFYKWQVERIGQEVVSAKTFGNTLPLQSLFSEDYKIWQQEIGEHVIEFRTWVKSFRLA